MSTSEKKNIALLFLLAIAVRVGDMHRALEAIAPDLPKSNKRYLSKIWV
ncbi:MAG: hypothetical protein V7K27_09960 [Nostoc sp.]